MNSFIKTVLLLSIISPFFYVTNNSSKEVRLTAQTNESISVEQKPYVTRLSLGDPLYLDGLIIKDSSSQIIEDYVVTEHDPMNLGEQVVYINYENFSTSFTVFVTNETVRTSLVTTNDLFISEFIYLDENNIGIELYNNTTTSINLKDYKIKVTYDGDLSPLIIDLTDGDIPSKKTFTIANNLANEENLQASQLFVDIDLSNAVNLTLVKNEKEIDTIVFHGETGWFSIYDYLFAGVMRRHYKVFNPSPTFTTNEWISTKLDTSNFNMHEVSSLVISIEEQAKAFARYVMFGAGMFAAGRVEEAYTSLKSEYSFMSNESKQYFIENKNVKVEGINETNKRVSVTFSDAHGRISVLASKTGNPSFIPASKGFSFNLGKYGDLLIIGVILTISLTGYFLFRNKFKKGS